MNTFTFPKRTQYEEERNYFWEKYFQSSLLNRKNWEYLDYATLEKKPEHVDVVYSPNTLLNIKGDINGNMYQIVKTISDKVKINKLLSKTKIVPKMMFFKASDMANSQDITVGSSFEKKVSAFLKTTDTFFYLKGSSGSVSRSTFIIKEYSDIVKNVNDNPEIPDWLLSENIESYLYRRQGQYQENGRNYSEMYGHKARVKFFILFKTDRKEKSVFMFDQSVFEIAPDEFKGDYTSRPQNIIIGMGSEDLPDYPENYDTDPDYGFSTAKIFGEDYFKKIVPQFIDITHKIFNVVHPDLHCKNDKYYNRDFKCCFQLCTVDVIITPELKCYFLEINTKPVMDRESYSSIVHYPEMIDSAVQECIDPWYPPAVQSLFKNGWHKAAHVPHNVKHTYYLSPTWRLTNELKKYFDARHDWESIVYPRYVLDRIDFVGKRKVKSLDSLKPDPLFQNAIISNKIKTLDFYLGDKKVMYDILSNDPKSFKFLPLTATFLTDEPGWENIVQHAMNYSKNYKTWILKPSSESQGKNILISENVNEVIDYIKSKKYNAWVLSQYIDNPFLLKLKGKRKSGAVFNDMIGRKTHIRIYTLVTKIKDISTGQYHTSIYLYDDSLIFCAVNEYLSHSLGSDYSNLTNLYLGSKYYSEVLGLDGSKAYQDLSFKLKDVLNKLKGPKFYGKVVLPQIRNMLETILRNAKDYLKCESINCFQYIAIDIMPDSKWNLHLLEINGRPGMNAPSYHWGGLQKFAETLVKNVYKK